MKAQSTFSILFWLSKNRIRNGKAQLFARITVEGKRAEIATHCEVSPLEWDSRAQMVVGKSQEAKEINNHLAIVKAKLLKCQSQLEVRNEALTSEKIKNEYVGKRPERKKITEAFQFWLDRIQEEVNKKKKAQATYNKYDDTFNHIKNFIRQQYKVSDKYLDEVDFSFITDFEYYLSVTLNLHNNTSMKYVSQAKTIFRMATKRGWILINPVASFSCSFEYGEPLRLELHELESMYRKEMPVRRLEEARDTYVFMCYTGYAYSDTEQLSAENIFWGIDKQLWITKDRQKTEGPECVPLLPIPLEIIEKYKNDLFCKTRGKLLPVRPNSKFNGYLKEIAAICHINKELTTHTGRHTFATSVTLENDVPLETVGKMLGHKSIKSTQRYARVTRKKIANNMQVLKKKLFNEDRPFSNKQKVDGL